MLGFCWIGPWSRADRVSVETHWRYFFQAVNAWQGAKPYLAVLLVCDSLLVIYDLEFRSERVVSGMDVSTFISIKNIANILMSFLKTTSLIWQIRTILFIRLYSGHFP